jgi:hypothetical protein
MYAIHFAAVDKANNNKTYRKVVFYDNISQISFLHKKVTRVETASAKTNFTWIDRDTNLVQVQWTERFRNERHEQNMWLNDVLPAYGIGSTYDDHHGARTVDKVPNVHGK